MNIKIVLFVVILVFISLLTTLIYQNTQQADINYYQARSYFEQSDYEQAISLYQQSLKYRPQHIEALIELGRSYLWTGKNKQAIAVLQEAVSLKPEDEKLKLSLAQAFSWQRRRAETQDSDREKNF